MSKPILRLIQVVIVFVLPFFVLYEQSFATSINPIDISIVLDKDELTVGETVTAHYEITGGNGDYRRIELSWYQLIPGNDVFAYMQGTNKEQDTSISAIGDYSFMPSVEGKIRFNIIVNDSNNMSKLAQSKIIDVTGSTNPLPINVIVSLDREEICLGETITAHYEISGGNEDYKRIELSWYQLIPGNDVFKFMKGTSKDQDSNISASGDYSFTPSTKGKIRFNIIVEDTNNMSKLGQSEIVIVSQEINYPESKMLFLPNDLQTINNESFMDTGFSYIVVPDSVIRIDSKSFMNCKNLSVVRFLGNYAEISDDAFGKNESIIFVCNSSSSMVAYAKSHGFICILAD